MSAVITSTGVIASTGEVEPSAPPTSGVTMSVPVPGAPAPAAVQLPEKNIALVGYTSSRMEAPFDDPAWELYGMNNLHMFMDPGKFTRWYNLHTPKEIEVDKEHLDWLRSWTKYPIFIMDPMEGMTEPDGSPIPTLAERTGWPAAVAFPRKNIEAMFGSYFTNTVSWQIAHVLYEAITNEQYMLNRLGLFGIDMAVGTEYADQRPSVEYFLGLAKGMGVDVTLPLTSDLLKCAYVYGASDDNGFAAKIGVRLEELTARKVEIEGQVQQLQHAHAATCGAIDSLRYVSGVWMPPTSRDRDKVTLAGGALSPVGDALAQADHDASKTKTT